MFTASVHNIWGSKRRREKISHILTPSIPGRQSEKRPGMEGPTFGRSLRSWWNLYVLIKNVHVLKLFGYNWVLLYLFVFVGKKCHESSRDVSFPASLQNVQCVTAARNIMHRHWFIQYCSITSFYERLHQLRTTKQNAVFSYQVHTLIIRSTDKANTLFVLYKRTYLLLLCGITFICWYLITFFFVSLS